MPQTTDPSPASAIADIQAPHSEEPSATRGFSDLTVETRIAGLPVQGSLPEWLTGSLVRVAPAQWDLGESTVRHWFDGQAMLHNFEISGGQVSYANRFLDTKQRRAVQETGKIAYSEFATDPCRSIFKRVQTMFSPQLTDNTNVNVVKLGERYIAMTETPIALEFDPETLDTLGVAYESAADTSTAHPHAERDSGGMLNFGTKFGPRNSYRFFELGPQESEPRVVATVATKHPSYQHSFGLTEHYIVLTEFPYTVNPVKLITGRHPFIENFEWHPDQPTRITLVDRATGETKHVFETEARFAFHHVNAFEQGDEVVVDICNMADPSIISDLYIEKLRTAPELHTMPHLERFTLNTATGTARIDRISDVPFELARINYRRCNERPYRYTWGNGYSGDSGWLDEIVKIDVTTGAAKRWSEPGAYPGEPVFVAAPEATDEDEGALLSVVFDASAVSSYLLVLDARDLTEVARATVPHHIPFGFHGQFVRA